MNTGATYAELKDFKNNLNNLNNENILELYALYRDNENKKELIKEILDLFPKFPGQRLDLDFIDEDKTMAVVTVYRQQQTDQGLKEDVISYLSYVNTKGVLSVYFKSYDKAILGCLCYKYNNTNLSSPQFWIEKMLDMKDTLFTENEVIQESENNNV